MQMLVEEHSEESLKNSSQGAEQMMTAVMRSITEGESKFQFKEQLEEARIQPMQEEMAEASLSKQVNEK
jgi:hypothetical protein